MDKPVSDRSTRPNPLTPAERKELEELHQWISREGSKTPLALKDRFCDLRKKHADWFFADREEQAKREWERKRLEQAEDDENSTNEV